MIKNANETLLRNIPEAEKILRKLRDEAEKLAKDKKLTIDTIEQLMLEASARFSQVLLGMSGELLSNIEVEKKR